MRLTRLVAGSLVLFVIVAVGLKLFGFPKSPKTVAGAPTTATAVVADRDQQDAIVHQWFYGSSAIQSGAQVYAKLEGRFPTSTQELCASPYIPARCTDLKIPPTNKDILSLTPEDPGYVGILQDNAIARLLGEYQDEVRDYRAEALQAGPGDLRDTDAARNLVAKYPVPADFGPSMIILRNDPFRDPKTNAVRFAQSFVVTLPHSYFEPPYRGSYARMKSELSNEERSAYSVADWVQQTISGYAGEKRRFPGSWAEVVLARPSYPLALLRNDFNGGFARETQTPSPGDFRIVLTIDTGYPGQRPAKVWFRHITVIGYGADGRIVYPSTRTPPPTPESEIKIPPGQEVVDAPW